jgi:hypothetical protein
MNKIDSKYIKIIKLYVIMGSAKMSIFELNWPEAVRPAD